MIHEDKNKKYKETIMKNVIFCLLSQKWGFHDQPSVLHAIIQFIS